MISKTGETFQCVHSRETALELIFTRTLHLCLFLCVFCSCVHLKIFIGYFSCWVSIPLTYSPHNIYTFWCIMVVYIMDEVLLFWVGHQTKSRLSWTTLYDWMNLKSYFQLRVHMLDITVYGHINGIAWLLIIQTTGLIGIQT